MMVPVLVPLADLVACASVPRVHSSRKSTAYDGVHAHSATWTTKRLPGCSDAETPLWVPVYPSASRASARRSLSTKSTVPDDLARALDTIFAARRAPLARCSHNTTWGTRHAREQTGQTCALSRLNQQLPSLALAAQRAVPATTSCAPACRRMRTHAHR